MYSPLTRDLERLRKGSPEFAAGTKFNYCNSGYVLLGHIIEKVSGKSYGDFVRDSIFEPLKMVNTGYDYNGLVLKHRAEGYSLRGDTIITAPFVDMSVPFAAGGLYSTVEDLYLWDQALYTEKLISKKSLEMMFTPFKKQYGYGWFIDEQFKRLCISHGGRIEGYMNSIERFPDDQSLLHAATPVYEELPGWTEDITGCRTFEELPANAQAYVRRLEELMGTRVSVIGVGPGRDESIILHDMLGRD